MTTVVTAVVAIALVAVLVTRPGAVAQPNEAWIASVGGTLFASTEDEIASVQSGQVTSTPELWVAGTSMTLLTVDAKLMPILPLIARPDAKRALVVAFGMGTAFRSALTAGLKTDVVELVPSVPEMFHFYYDDADAVLADPDGKVIVADGRNHLELSDERFDIIVTDPPPPIESSGASVISSKEYYEAGRDHLTEGGVMMQWTPYGAPESEFKEHIRTFASVYPYVMVVQGAGGYGAYMLGSEQPIELDPAIASEVLARPGVLEDISSAYDSPASTIDGWLDVIRQQTWLADAAAVQAYVGDGPLITDDHPRPEYFLIRRLTDGIRTGSRGRRPRTVAPAGCPRNQVPGFGCILALMTAPTLATEPACPGSLDSHRLPKRSARALHAERRPFADIPRETWDALAARNPMATPFSAWAFHRAWWDAYADNAHEETLVVTSEDAVAAGRDRRDRAAHAPPRGGADRRADPHDDAPRRGPRR